MRALILFPFAVILILLAAVTIEPGVATATPRASTGDAAEVRRIRAHFDSVLTELAARDVHALPSAQRAQRVTLLHTLRAYRNRGVFPHNYDFPGTATPYFVDRKTGTLCAVAYLLASTGRRDIVDRVASAGNNVWVSALAPDTAFVRWLEANGLSLAEAARIQVPYVVVETPAQRARNVAFLTAAPIALGGSVIASIWNAGGNADGHRRLGNVLGLTSGAMAIGMGATLATKPGFPRGIGVASAALGGVSVALASRAIRRHNADVALAREAERARATVETSVAPIVPSGPHTGAGVAVSLRF
jgi:hypothetical protein